MEDLVVRLAVVVAVVGAVALVGAWWRRREGQVRRPAGAGFSRAELHEVGLDDESVAVRGLLLTSPTCAPCRTVKRVLTEVGDARPGFAWVAVDVAHHLDLARRHHVLRVPTLFLVDADGRVLARTSGVPAVRDIARVVDQPAGDDARGALA
ncbi:MAG: thioredoxin family protein [Actinomycetota bacterium]|nr:thioredoxin family protein [Actinomycetota bacterium]